MCELQIPDSHYEKENTQNEHIIARIEYFFLLVTIVRLSGLLRI